MYHLLEQNNKSDLVSDLVVAVVTAVGLPIEFWKVRNNLKREEETKNQTIQKLDTLKWICKTEYEVHGLQDSFDDWSVQCSGHHTILIDLEIELFDSIRFQEINFAYNSSFVLVNNSQP